MRAYPVLTVGVSLLASQANPQPAAPTASWVKVTGEAAFSPRDTSEDLVYGGRMWLSNAYHVGNVLVRDLWQSADGATWTLVSDNTPYDGYSEMIVYQDHMWAIKGSVWNSTDGKQWARVLEHTPFGVRGYGEVVLHQDRMWQLGSGEDVWSTTDGVNWTCATEHAPYGKRFASAVAAYGGKLWVMGGSTPGASDPPEKGYKDITTHNDVWCSADGANWTRVAEHAPWAERQWFIAREYKGKLWIIGGYDNRNQKNFADAWCTEEGKRWQELVSETHFSPRHEPSVYVFQDSLWVVAGNSWPLMNDVWKLTLP